MVCEQARAWQHGNHALRQTWLRLMSVMGQKLTLLATIAFVRLVPCVDGSGLASQKRHVASCSHVFGLLARFA